MNTGYWQSEVIAMCPSLLTGEIYTEASNYTEHEVKTCQD